MVSPTPDYQRPRFPLNIGLSPLGALGVIIISKWVKRGVLVRTTTAKKTHPLQWMMRWQSEWTKLTKDREEVAAATLGVPPNVVSRKRRLFRSALRNKMPHPKRGKSIAAGEGTLTFRRLLRCLRQSQHE